MKTHTQTPKTNSPDYENIIMKTAEYTSRFIDSAFRNIVLFSQYSSAYFYSLEDNTQLCIYSYGIVAGIVFFASTYRDGEKSLNGHRIALKYDTSGYLDNTRDGEISVITGSCRRNFLRNFATSVLFPCTLLNNIVPYFVILFNPREPVDDISVHSISDDDSVHSISDNNTIGDTPHNSPVPVEVEGSSSDSGSDSSSDSSSRATLPRTPSPSKLSENLLSYD
jgi:hypothetical protein